MDNLDLDISNYSIDDLKTFLNIDAITFDYADLQKNVKKKILQIQKIQNYDEKDKKNLIKFINQINLKLIEQIQIQNKIEEFKKNPSLDIKHPTTTYEFPPYKKKKFKST